jgi:arylsulfatase A-like enzyme
MIQCGREVTPNLNKLASEGVNFTRAYSASPVCVPSRTALATGIYPTRSGMVLNDFQGKYSKPHPTVYDLLKNAGYYIGHVGIDHIRVLPPLKDSGLMFHCDDHNYWKYLKENDVTPMEEIPETGKKLKVMRDGELTEVKMSGAHVGKWGYDTKFYKDGFFADKAGEFLDMVKKRPDNQPFALFLYLWAPHPPLIVPSEYADMYDPEKVDIPPNVGIPSDGEPPFRRDGLGAQLAEGVPADHWKKAWAAHLALTTYADDIIGKLFDRLKEMGEYGDTTVVFTCDHGEHLGQHGMYQKFELYDQCINIPLIIKDSGFSPAVRNEAVSHVDVVPTLCDLLSLKKPDNLDGISLTGAMGNGQYDGNRIIYSNYFYCLGEGPRRLGAIGNRYKYIIDEHGGEELYDMQNDPLEMLNLAGKAEYNGILADLSAKCREYHAPYGYAGFPATM